MSGQENGVFIDKATGTRWKKRGPLFGCGACKAKATRSSWAGPVSYLNIEHVDTHDVGWMPNELILSSLVNRWNKIVPMLLPIQRNVSGVLSPDWLVLQVCTAPRCVTRQKNLFVFFHMSKKWKMSTKKVTRWLPPLFCMQSTMVPQSLEDDCLYSNAQNQEIANKFTWVISRHEVLTRWFFPSSFRWLSNKQKRLNCQKSPRLLNHSVHVISYLKTPG